MMFRQSLRTVAVAVILAACGCSQARLVSVDSSGGIVAIPNNTNRWPCYNRKAADELMARQFPEGYLVDSEGEVVIGRTTTVDTTGNRDSAASQLLGIGQQTERTVSHDVTEWHIRFHPKKASLSATTVTEGPPPVQTGQAPAVVPAAFELPREPIPVTPGQQ